MQEVKLRALRTEWSRKREGRRAQEGDGDGGESGSTQNIYMYGNLKKMK